MNKKNKSQMRGQMSTSRSSSSADARAQEFNPDYSYVKKDLQRIGLLAGFFITVLVGLSFFLR